LREPRPKGLDAKFRFDDIRAAMIQIATMIVARRRRIDTAVEAVRI
jgi:hypothetical protein